MKNREHIKTEIKYKRFDIISKIASGFMSVLSIAVCILFIFAKTDELKLLFGLILALEIVAIALIAPIIAKKRNAYLQLIQDERNKIVRTGLFKDIYDAYRHDGFEFNLTYDKLLFTEYHNNIISIGVRKNDREFLIDIDENLISIIVDEEEEHPIETEIFLSDIAAMEQLYLTINSFIDENSRSKPAAPFDPKKE